MRICETRRDVCTVDSYRYSRMMCASDVGTDRQLRISIYVYRYHIHHVTSAVRCGAVQGAHFTRLGRCQDCRK